MTKRVLAIGIGGTGKTALTILKERLEETYGRVPDNVVLLSLDTDDLRDVDTFAGTKLNGQYDGRGREPEYRGVVSKSGVTMDTIFADLAKGHTNHYMHWLEKEKLSRILGPAERDIRGGAQQRRPIGRVAVFQRWDNPIYASIVEAIARVYGEPEEEQPVDTVRLEQSKRLVFIIGSMAGGTGSGFFIDTANLVRHAVQSTAKWQSIDVSGIVVLPDAFSAYTTRMNDPSNLKPNSCAALRELDRFLRAHSTSLPYMIRYGDDLRAITWSVNQPLDHVYLVDTASSSGIGDLDLSGDPTRGVFPIISDFVMAHVDQSTGDSLATLRSNAGHLYDKSEGRQYSSFNVMTYILPIDDIIESFSYRFVREMLAREFMAVSDSKLRAQVELEAAKEAERVFSENSVGGKVNPGVVQKSIAATRRVDPETPDVSWTGLFNMIALSESAFASDYQDLEGWLTYLSGNMIPSKEGDFKKEGYDEGYIRLTNFAEDFQEKCLGKQMDPDDEESRFGGQWDSILARYREALRLRFAEVLDVAMLEMLNRRDPQSKILLPARLPATRHVVATLKEKLVRFKVVLTEEYRRQDVDTRIRQTGEELRNAITWMQETKDKRPAILAIGKSDARKAQEAYIALFSEKMELALHQRVFRVVTDILDALGAADQDKDGNLSVIDQAALEMENWQATFQEVDKRLDRMWRTHERNREEKRLVKVRRYLTDKDFETQLYQRPEHLGMVAGRVMGQIRGEKGLEWQRKDETVPLDLKLVSMWTEQASGPEEIAARFFGGVKELFRVVRENVTIVDRLAATFKSPPSFVNVVNQVNEPFLRYNPSANDGKPMFMERYVAFNLDRAGNDARQFMEQTLGTLRDQGMNVNTSAESLVACMVVEVSRGVKLSAVEQFTACEPDYRVKLYQGQESLHLFPEEQVATAYENLIEKLNEPNNRQRMLAPELVTAMGDEDKLRIFVLACAYGLIEPGSYWDVATGAESREIYLDLNPAGGQRRLVLSQSRLVRQLDPKFELVASDDQISRLYLNALQNFVLKVTQKPGVPMPMVATVVETLRRYAVDLSHIENPFTLTLREVGEAIKLLSEQLGPDETEQSDRRRRESLNASRRVEKYLKPFLDGRVASFKRSPAQRVRDMGTVMHLILEKEINSLINSAAVAGPKR